MRQDGLLDALQARVEELASIILNFKYVALCSSRIELDAMSSPTNNSRELLKVRLTHYDHSALQEIEHLIVKVFLLLLLDLPLYHCLDLLSVSRCGHLMVLPILLLLLFNPSLRFHLFKGV